MNDTRSWASEQFCYLTTVGRKTGNPHTIEIWFALSYDGRTLYMLSGGRDRADWVRNIAREPRVEVQVADTLISGTGRVVDDEQEALSARVAVVAKYYGREYNPSGGWEADSLPIAIDLVR